MKQNVEQIICSPFESAYFAKTENFLLKVQ